MISLKLDDRLSAYEVTAYPPAPGGIPWDQANAIWQSERQRVKIKDHTTGKGTMGARPMIPCAQRRGDEQEPKPLLYKSLSQLSLFFT